MSVEQIQALADGLAARLGRAVLVDDRDLRLVAASEDFGDADPARVWSLLHRRTRPEDVRHEEIARLPGPGYVPENPALELWQRLCVPVRCRGLLLGFVWITDRFGDLTEEQVADSARTAAEIGVLLRDRLLAGGRDRARRHELVEQRQADTALSTVGDCGAACWAELSADALLAQFPHQVWTDALLPEGAVRLLADRTASTLLPTLGAFLDCAGDVRRTAAELRVHRTTLYRARAATMGGRR